MRGAALTRPNVIARVVSVVALVAAIVVVVVLVSGSSNYVLKLTMANAQGLQPGSQVFLGGVPVGTVTKLDMNRAGDKVIATLEIGKGQAHIGRGVNAHIIATNLLGTESVQLNPGDRRQPVPSGTTLPESATTLPTALDQIVDTLDQPTRVDLALLLREAGLAVTGRRTDVSAILRQFPLSLHAFTQLVQGLVNDNHSVADFIANSNYFIARVNAQEPQLKRLLTAAGGATQTFADKADALARTVQLAPPFFREVKVWFAALANGANHLNTVAPGLTQSMAPLDQTLKEIGPFASAAVPTLNKAAQVAPSLSDLALQATPTLRQAGPTLASLSTLAKLSQPLSAWLGLSSPDLFGIFDSWTHAIQSRDGVSHIFNGDLYLNPQIVLQAANQGASPQQKAQNLVDLAPSIVRTLGLESQVAKAKAFLAGLAAHHTAAANAPSVAPSPAHPSGAASFTPAGGSGAGGGTSSGGGGVPHLGGALGAGLSHVLSGALGLVAPKPPTGATGSSATGSGSSGSSGGGSGAASALTGLLGYLLGR
jgi:phospholipid/cholesterol/gamma-HCH transport system substrate-binding protein